jgi:hypothetical protein
MYIGNPPSPGRRSEGLYVQAKGGQYVLKMCREKVEKYKEIRREKTEEK